MTPRMARAMHRPLLLSAREPGARFGQAVLDFVPEARLAQAALDDLVEFRLCRSQPVNAWSVGDVFGRSDFGNGLGFWNTMPTRARSSTTSSRRIVKKCCQPSSSMFAGHPRADVDRVVHPVETAQESWIFPQKPEGADQRRHPMFPDRQVDVEQRLFFNIKDVDVPWPTDLGFIRPIGRFAQRPTASNRVLVI